MKVDLLAIGKGAASPEMELFSLYQKRNPWRIALQEFTPKQADPTKRHALECAALLKAADGADKVIVLDERGKDLSSRALAALLEQWRTGGASRIACVIGGADGVDDGLRARADLVWSLGKATWPHLLVRALVAEQLFRAQCLLTNHPYHRD